MTAKPKWIVERGSFEAPEYLRVGDADIWVDDRGLATEFETEADALVIASTTGVDELRITEKDE